MYLWMHNLLIIIYTVRWVIIWNVGNFVCSFYVMGVNMWVVI